MVIYLPENKKQNNLVKKIFDRNTHNEVQIE